MTINYMAEHDNDHVRARLSSRDSFGAGLNLITWITLNAYEQVVQMANAIEKARR